MRKKGIQRQSLSFEEKITREKNRRNFRARLSEAGRAGQPDVVLEIAKNEFDLQVQKKFTTSSLNKTEETGSTWSTWSAVGNLTSRAEVIYSSILE